ncbi:VCBS domain-containing protein [Vibrio japonicus]|uniref:VCBS domain-containing protein n=1 Tax=Vibrio japonicus TaxID=1824638 RepID=A0ABY5LC71_9VIBR|nr:VCBS domain-containing protein [Vibrio japonicus]UUM29446.1 VCBS domain-containing protein [Vibrio japonicus]
MTDRNHGEIQVVTITIHGANDGAKITGDDSGSVTEDAAETTATGTLLASETDNVTGQPIASTAMRRGHETVDALNVDETDRNLHGEIGRRHRAGGDHHHPWCERRRENHRR